jgi:hypothetical protein
MAKALPLSHWLALEDSVAHHKAEITRQFAEARARLLPEMPDPDTWTEAEMREAYGRWMLAQIPRIYEGAFNFLMGR